MDVIIILLEHYFRKSPIVPSSWNKGWYSRWSGMWDDIRVKVDWRL